MKSSLLLNGILTALFSVIFFCGGMSPGYATTFTPNFTDCFLGTPSWNIEPEPGLLDSETTISCQYEPNPRHDEFMTSDHPSSHTAMNWQGYGFMVEWEGDYHSPFGEGSLSRPTDKPFEGTIFKNEMFWNHADASFGRQDPLSFRLMMKGAVE